MIKIAKTCLLFEHQHRPPSSSPPQAATGSQLLPEKVAPLPTLGSPSSQLSPPRCPDMTRRYQAWPAPAPPPWPAPPPCPAQSPRSTSASVSGAGHQTSTGPFSPTASLYLPCSPRSQMHLRHHLKKPIAKADHQQTPRSPTCQRNRAAVA